ncbi:GNAT family N-acetyltransferase [Aeromonas sobria]|uniref:GNAT family N-acetyltransferase n=1 Tax=Aeromonas sobria TaxID=646 RepID=UPI003F3C80FA
MMNITKINTLESVENLSLRKRAENARCGRSKEFVAIIDGREAGLLSYEDWSEQSLGFIYEIFVLPEYRTQGVGRGLLSYAEELAKELHCTSIQLKPYPLDRTLVSEWLVSWYARHGYVQKADDLEKMEKSLVGTRP